MRLFVAVDLDAASREAIAVLQQRVAAALDARHTSITWVRADHMHLTLVFLGEVPDGAVGAVVDAMGRPIAREAFAMTLTGLGAFPPSGPPRVLWVGIGQGADHLALVQQEIAARALANGVELESRPFHPHLTLGRWRDSRPGDRRAALSVIDTAPIAQVVVNAATLYQSRLSPAGPQYTALARAKLIGG